MHSNYSNFQGQMRRPVYPEHQAFHPSPNLEQSHHTGTFYERKLLPNEMRISTKGEMKLYVHSAMTILKQGYANLNIVGRGQAVPLTEELTDILKRKNGGCDFQVRFTQALNKKGFVCEEIHVMISQK